MIHWHWLFFMNSFISFLNNPKSTAKARAEGPMGAEPPNRYQMRFFNPFKAGVHINRSEIWSIIKRELLGLKWVGNTSRQFSPRLVRDCLASIH